MSKALYLGYLQGVWDINTIGLAVPSTTHQLVFVPPAKQLTVRQLVLKLMCDYGPPNESFSPFERFYKPSRKHPDLYCISFNLGVDFIRHSPQIFHLTNSATPRLSFDEFVVWAHWHRCLRREIPDVHLVFPDCHSGGFVLTAEFWQGKLTLGSHSVVRPMNRGGIQPVEIHP